MTIQAISPAGNDASALGVGPVRGHEEGRRPRERRHPTRDQSLVGPGVTAGAGPTVAEVVAARHQGGAAGHGQRGGPRQAVELPARQPPQDSPHHGNGRHQGQARQEHQRRRHHHHRRSRRGGVGLRPLPADGQLRPHGDAEGEEGGQRAPHRRQAGLRFDGGLERSAAQSRRRQPRHEPVAGHVAGASPRARSLREVRDQQLGELVAVARSPLLRVPAQQGLGAANAPGGRFVHLSPTCRRAGAAPRRPLGAGRRGGPEGPRRPAPSSGRDGDGRRSRRAQ